MMNREVRFVESVKSCCASSYFNFQLHVLPIIIQTGLHSTSINLDMIPAQYARAYLSSTSSRIFMPLIYDH